eukprot:1092291-Lingulodinium_polyedra.AAC.1
MPGHRPGRSRGLRSNGSGLRALRHRAGVRRLAGPHSSAGGRAPHRTGPRHGIQAVGHRAAHGLERHAGPLCLGGRHEPQPAAHVWRRVTVPSAARVPASGAVRLGQPERRGRFNGP